ncbi:MAG: nucleotidyltransferase domain-containing protein [Myxococcales bacterium]|nr:MAG: nucleotidyltransferase domain-containing protein [Myxococcales bacterium]
MDAEHIAGVPRPPGPGGRPSTPLDVRPLRVLLERIEARFHPEQVWLFGSRARGEASPDSDWDLLVVVPDSLLDVDLDPVVAWRLQRGSGVRADVIPCRASEFRSDRDTVNTIAYSATHDGFRLDER